MNVQLNQDDLVISHDDLKSYAMGNTDNKVYKIWQNVLGQLPAEARREIEDRGFALVDDPDVPNDAHARYFQMKIEDSEEALKIKCLLK